MATQTEALKLALEALEDYVEEYGPHEKDSGAAYVITAIKEVLAQPEQEPFRFTDKENWLSGNGRMWSEMHREDGDFPIYTTPPQRTWVGLSYEDFIELARTIAVNKHQARAIEAKLKEKNT